MPDTRKFARKALRDNDDPRLFNAERQNLTYVKRIQDRHLVQIIKAYKHGDVGNIILPLAKTNLGAYLRDPSYKASEQSHQGIEVHPFWEQMLGVSRALHKILDYEAVDSTRNEVLYGYHFDLKPANVLIENSGVFVISDFGQAYFRKLSEATSSKVRGMGGTESYAPPEIDDPAMLQNRRYDIWSLGCILLEICTFVVRGYPGVLELDAARITTTANGNMTDDRFFVRSESEQWELKPQIRDWMQNLPTVVHSHSAKRYIQRILSLVVGMLQVDVRQRLTSKDVCLTLSDILSNRHSGVAGENIPVFPKFEPRVDEAEIGKRAIARINRIMYNAVGYWNPGPLRLVQRKGSLVLLTWENDSWTRTFMGEVSHLKVVPRYALRDDAHHRYNDASLYICSGPGAQGAAKILNEKFWSESIDDTLLLQEALLGQKVVQNLNLQEALPSLYSDRSQKIQRKLFGSRSHESSLPSERAKTVQLWTECLISDAASPDPSLTKGPTHRTLRYGPSPPRIAIFYSELILIIKLAKNIRVVASPSNVESSCSISFGPTDRSADPRFFGLILRKAEGEISPGIPISRKVLEWEEEYRSLEFDSLLLVFNCLEDSKAFLDAYRRLKFHWSNDQAEFEKRKHDVGPMLGYARNGI